ncbi:hypothetical protein [Streptomyces hypolithicus]
MARHAGPKSQRSALLRVGLAVTAAGAALSAGGGAAQAAAQDEPQQAGRTGQASQASVDNPLEKVDLAATGRGVSAALGYTTAGVLAPVKDIRPNPLAGTGVNPLDNGLGTQVADFKPVSTGMVTAPLTDGGAVQELPLLGAVTDLLPG